MGYLFILILFYHVIITAMINTLDGLNLQQQEAVLYSEGPLLVLAGAGSGKTKTLTHKIAHLLGTGIQENQILALTFTNKAAKEMRERIANLIGVNNNYYFMPYMGTFHSISVKMLRIDGGNIGIDSNFIIYDESDKLSTIKRILKNIQISEKEYAPKTIASIISDNKSKGMSSREYGQHVQTPIQKITFQVMAEYENELKKSNALDFDDLILKNLNLISSDTTIRAKWQNQFKFILVDEYQDTNQAQYQLIKLLVNEQKNICVVGDDWQSVYSWRGADYTNILNFERDFKNAKIIKLEQNYRSTGNILNAAGKVIANNKNKAEKKLWTASGPGEEIEIIQASNEAHEADIISTKIKNIKFKGGNLNQVAILYRTNAQSRAVEESLMRNGLPYQLIGGTRFYDRKEIKDILSYLKLLYQKNDIASFIRSINVPSRGLGKVSLDNFIAWISSSGLSLDEALNTVCGAKNINKKQGQELYDISQLSITTEPKLTPKAKASIADFYILINKLNEQKDGSEVYELIESIISVTSYKNYLKLTDKNWEERLENINELVNVAKQYTGYSLNEFIEATALQTAGEENINTPQEEATKLMTLHASKGLEFDTVFMIGMEESIFPSSRSLSEQDQLEEERRLCYVGMTRAKKKLYLAFATKRMLWGTSNFNMPSRFLEESGLYQPADYKQNIAFTGFELHSYGDKNARPADPNAFLKDSFTEKHSIVLNIGDKVKHQLFGVGFIESVEDSDAMVTFSTGKKKLNLEYAPLEKL